VSKWSIETSRSDTIQDYRRNETKPSTKKRKKEEEEKDGEEEGEEQGDKVNRDRANANLGRKSRSKRYRVDRKNRQVLSQDFQSEHFTRFEVEAICQYFKQRVTPDFLDQLGQKMVADSKTNVKQWNADDVGWQKTILKEVEESRQPFFFRHNVKVPKPTLHRSKNNGKGHKKISAVVFNGQKKTVLDEDGNIPKRTRDGPAWSMTDRVETTNLTDPYWKTVQKNFLMWDDIRDSEYPYHAGNSVVLSQNTAVSEAHVHQWMFWNLVSEGTKLYLMYPIKKPEVTQSFKYNVKTPKMDKTDDFLKLGTIGRISSEIDDAPRFLIAPGFTSHHVITANRKEGGYWGSGGFGSVTQLKNADYKGIVF
jgi:hypothetical protein